MPNILTRWFPPRETKTITEALILNLDLQTSTHRSYPQLVQESFGMNSLAFRAISMLAESVATVPILLYQRDATGDDTEVPSHPLLDVMARPNSAESGRQFRAALTADLKTAGEAFILKLAASNNRRVELHLLRPDLVTVNQSRELGGDATFEYRDATGRQRAYSREDVLHIRTLDPLRTGRGFSSVRAVSLDLDQSNLAGRWNVSLLKNAGRPSMMVLSKSQLAAEQLQQLRESMLTKFAGSAAAGRIAVLDGTDVTVEQLGMNPTQMDWLEGKNAAEARIATGLGVPPELLNLGQTTFNNRFEAKKSLYQETIVPLLTLVLEELNAWLTPALAEGADLRLVPYWEKIDALQPDRTAEYKRLDDAVAAGWLTINEARGEVGFDPDDTYGSLYKWQADALARFGSLPSLPKSERKVHLGTEAQKTAYWKAQDTRKRAYEANLAKNLRGIMDAERLRIKTSSAQSAADIEAVALAAIDEGAYQNALTPAYMAVMEDFGDSTLRDLNAKRGLAMETKAFEDVFGVLFQEVLSFIARNVARAVTHVTDTTRSRIRDLIGVGVDNGDSIGVIAKSIDGLYLEQIIPNRSVVIARTEVIKSSNAGSLMAARGTGIPLVKTWLATRDDRTRDDHAFADGQTVPADQPFDVGGELLDFPGDPSGSPGNIIQCRCTFVTEPA